MKNYPGVLIFSGISTIKLSISKRRRSELHCIYPRNHGWESRESAIICSIISRDIIWLAHCVCWSFWGGWIKKDWLQRRNLRILSLKLLTEPWKNICNLKNATIIKLIIGWILKSRKNGTSSFMKGFTITRWYMTAKNTGL